MGTFAGAGYFHCCRYTQLVTRLHEGAGILPPLGLVEIDGQEMAAIVLQQWIHADGMPARQMVVDDSVG